ncbi:hypothetical protein M8C21_008197, partial [Ambrosia artemisiifolia]
MISPDLSLSALFLPLSSSGQLVVFRGSRPKAFGSQSVVFSRPRCGMTSNSLIIDVERHQIRHGPRVDIL